MKGLLVVLTVLVWCVLVVGLACLLWSPESVIWFTCQVVKFAVLGAFAAIVTVCAFGAMESIGRL